MALMQSLLNLNRVDAQVRALRSRVDAAERYYKAQSKQLSELQLQLTELEGRRKQLRAAIGNLENEIRVVDERLEKFRNDLNSSVTQKQYAAVLSEMNTVKQTRKELEDRTLEQMEQVEAAEQAIVKLNEQIAERQKIHDAAKLQCEERKHDVADGLADLERERGAAASLVPLSDLDKFEKLVELFDGEPMSPIEEISRRHREYACGQCRFQIPFDRVSILMTSSDDLVYCPCCHRILYLEEATRGALTKH